MAEVKEKTAFTVPAPSSTPDVSCLRLRFSRRIVPGISRASAEREASHDTEPEEHQRIPREKIADRRQFLRNTVRMGGAAALLLSSGSRRLLVRSLELDPRDLETARQARNVPGAPAGTEQRAELKAYRSSGGCDGCEGSCLGSCVGGCLGSCVGTCLGDCLGSCTGSCLGGCQGGCLGSCLGLSS